MTFVTHTFAQGEEPSSTTNRIETFPCSPGEHDSSLSHCEFELPDHPQVKTFQKVFISSDTTSEEILKTFQQLKPYTEVQFLSGSYRISSALPIEDLEHIRIIGSSDVTFIGTNSNTPTQLVKPTCSTQSDCQWRPGDGDWVPIYPEFNGFSVFNLKNSHHVEFSEIHIENSWPNGIMIENSEFVKIKRSSFIYGTNAIYALGRRTKNIEVSESSWSQDPDGKLWSSYHWQHAHHGLLSHFNGAFFQSRDIFGNVSVHGNKITHAFNGVRMKVSSEKCGPLRCNFNQNISITNNFFSKISDNVIEPEVYMENWQVIENKIFDAHAPFSFSGVRGRNFNLTRNSVVFFEKPRQQLDHSTMDMLPANDLSPHNGGCIFKLKKSGIIEGYFTITNNSFSTSYIYGNFKPIEFQKGKFPKNTVFTGNKDLDGHPILHIIRKE